MRSPIVFAGPLKPPKRPLGDLGHQCKKTTELKHSFFSYSMSLRDCVLSDRIKWDTPSAVDPCHCSKRLLWNSISFFFFFLFWDIQVSHTPSVWQESQWVQQSLAEIGQNRQVHGSVRVLIGVWTIFYCSGFNWNVPRVYEGKFPRQSSPCVSVLGHRILNKL